MEEFMEHKRAVTVRIGHLNGCVQGAHFVASSIQCHSLGSLGLLLPALNLMYNLYVLGWLDLRWRAPQKLSAV